MTHSIVTFGGPLQPANMLFALKLVFLAWLLGASKAGLSDYLPSWSDAGSYVSNGIRYLSKAAEDAWESIRSVDTEKFLNPDTYVPDVSIISTDPNDIRFLLYTDPNNPTQFEVLSYNDLNSIRLSDYDPSKPAKFLVHGFTNDYNSTYPQNVKNAYLAKKGDMDVNVIIMDWSALAIPRVPYIADVFYPFAVNNVWTAGERLGDFISWLQNSGLIDLDRTHILGHSLGSHVSGKAGDKVKQSTGRRVGRITALDPAGPAFYTGNLARSINKEDGQFVDAIHTNAGQLGIWQNVGQVDFYMNGGSGPQPGCNDLDSASSVLKVVASTVVGSCSHSMAPKFYGKTILEGLRRPEEMLLCSCQSLTRYTVTRSCCDTEVIFGEYCPHDTVGEHYLSYSL